MITITAVAIIAGSIIIAALILIVGFIAGVLWSEVSN